MLQRLLVNLAGCWHQTQGAAGGGAGRNDTNHPAAHGLHGRQHVIDFEGRGISEIGGMAGIAAQRQPAHIHAAQPYPVAAEGKILVGAFDEIAGIGLVRQCVRHRLRVRMTCHHKRQNCRCRSLQEAVLV